MSRLRLAALLLLALALPARGAARRVAVVAAEDDALTPALERALGSPPPPGVRLHTFSRQELADPIKRGSLLARLAANDVVVPVGDAAAALALQELEDEPVFVIGAAVLPGERLASSSVSGLIAYDPAALARAAAELGPGKIGVVYTRGYGTLAGAARDAARAAGREVEQRAVASVRELPEALGALLSRCKAVVLLGDPVLARGAGFQFAAERSLSLRVPLVSTDLWQVRHGAFLGARAAPEPLAQAGAAAVRSLAHGEALPKGLRPAPSLSIVVNAALSRNWGLRGPEGEWQPVQ